MMTRKPPRRKAPPTEAEKYYSKRQHQMPHPTTGALTTFGSIQDEIFDLPEGTDKDMAYANLRNRYGKRMKRLIGHYGNKVPEKFNAPYETVDTMTNEGFGKFIGAWKDRINFQQDYKNVDFYDPDTKPAKALGGPVGMLSPLPSLVIPKRGMSQESLAFPRGGFAVQGASNNMRDRRGQAGQIPNYAYGGPLPEYGDGGRLAGGALKGAAGGAATGASIGSIIPGWGTAVGGAIGGLVGGIKGFFSTKNQIAEEDEIDQDAIARERQGRQTTKLFADMSALGTFPTQGVEGSNYYAAMGGPIQPQYMAEGGETLIHDNEQPQAFNGALNQISSDMSEIQGPSHASPQGGVEMSGGDFVMSKRMKGTKELQADLQDILGYTPKDTTYAGIAKSIGKKKGDLEEKLASNDPISSRTAEIMIERYDEALELTALEQENRKNKTIA